MSDTVLTVGSGEPATGTAVTETPVQTTGTEQAASESGQTESSDGGSSKGSTDNSQQEQTQRRGWSKVDEIRELRQDRRQLRERESSLLQEIAELRAMRNESAKGNGNAARTPANFWQDPEAVLEARIKENMESLREAITGEFRQVRESDYQTQALNQERGQAVEFIRSQKGYSQDDDDELIHIIEENGLSTLNPMQAAKAAWSIYQQERGVGDRSVQKRQAASVMGQPPGAGLGKKIWSQTEYDRTLDELMKNPMKMTTELEAELMGAAREGRVR